MKEITKIAERLQDFVTREIRLQKADELAYRELYENILKFLNREIDTCKTELHNSNETLVMHNLQQESYCRALIDVQNNILLNWKTALGHFVTSKLRYRRTLDKTRGLDNYLSSCKSNVKTYSYKT